MSNNDNSVIRPKIVGLSHMAFWCRDLDKTLGFYNDILGYRDIVVEARAGGSALVRFNDRQYVHLVPEQEPDTGRMIRFGFEVEDAEAMRSYLVAKGVAGVGEVARNEGGSLAFQVADPDAHTVEFVQYDEHAWPAAAMPPSGDWRAPSLRSISDGANPHPISDVLMHIGFTVGVLEKSMEFYRDVLGFVEMWRGTDNGEVLSWVQLRVPEDRNYIEFMLYDEPPSLERLGIFDHYGLEVESVNETVASLDAFGAFREYDRTVSPKVGVCRHWLSNLFDPDGTRAEPMERSTFDGSVTPSATVPPPR